MPSPFPGMDPYLEISGLWPDFHQRFNTYWCDQISDSLPDRYEARIDERVHLVELELDEQQIRQIRPDVAVLDRGGQGRSAASGAVATLESVTIPLLTTTQEVRESWIEIFHRPDHALVAVLELLSPTNKADAGYGDYLAKRAAILRQRVHLVELDLLLTGHRMPLSAALPQGDYYSMVARSDRRPNVDVYSWSVRDRLPTIPIPLRAPDPDIGTNLAAVFATAYERGRYARSIDYSKKLDLPLGEAERAWAEQQGRSATR
jgi:hypothetical protein